MDNLLSQEYLYTVLPIAVLSLALAGVAVSYVFLLLRLGKSEKDKVYLQSKIRDHSMDILKEAHEKRLKIIQDAISKAGAIIQDTQFIGADVKTQFASDIQEMKKKQEEFLRIRQEHISKLYDDFEADMRKSTAEQFKILSKNMENLALGSVKEYKEEIEAEKVSIHKQIDQKIEEEVKKSQKHIEEYKLDQMKKIDKRVFDILEALTRDILGKSLTLKDHEDLIQKALVQLKTDMNSEI